MNVLLVSLYFPPLNTIAAQRAFAFYNSLRDNGYRVFVITRYYDKEQALGSNMLLGSQAPKEFDSKFMSPYEDVYYTDFNESSSEMRVFQVLPMGIRGAYNILSGDVFHSGWTPNVLKLLNDKLSNQKFDLIIGSYGPPIILKLTKLLSKKLQSPYIIDFRDAYIDERDSGLSLLFKRFAQKKFLKDSSGLIFVSEGMRNYFEENCGKEFCNIPAEFICNGFVKLPEVFTISDVKVMEEFLNIKSKYDLVFLHTGTIYKDQEIECFFNWFAEVNENIKLALVFVGLSKDYGIRKSPHVYEFNRVSQSASCKMQDLADALILPIWRNRYTGFSGKLLEYLYCGSPVICGPNPQNDLLPFFQKSGNVYVAHDMSKFKEIVLQIKKAEITKKIPNDRDFFTRDYWMKKCVNFIDRIIK